MNDDDTIYSIYSTWIDGIPRVTRILATKLELTPKWLSVDHPPPVDLCDAIRLAQGATKTRFGVEPSELVRMRVTLETIEPDMCFWCVTFLHCDRSQYHSVEIGVLMDGTVVMPEPDARNNLQNCG
jgi:hypothetical protein